MALSSSAPIEERALLPLVERSLDLDALAVGEDFLRAEIHHLAVARENVVQADRHLERLVALLTIFSGLGIHFVVDDLRDLLASRRIAAEETAAAVGAHGAPRAAVPGRPGSRPRPPPFQRRSKLASPGYATAGGTLKPDPAPA